MSSCLKYLILSCILSSCAASTQQTFVKYNRNELKKRTFNYFWETTDTVLFQVLDRYPTRTFSSIAATGFGLTSYLVGIENGYISRTEGALRIKNTLEVLWNLPQSNNATNVSGYQGFFYHFLRLDNAHRYKNVELSSIDTGLLMAGVLSCMTYFENSQTAIEKEIVSLSEKLYQRVNWQWMMQKNGKMSMGWHPESGFIQSDWSGYNEAMILLIMAMGSPTFPIDSTAWTHWCQSYVLDTFCGQKNVQFDPLFGHQYSHMYIDFRGIFDAYTRASGIDYFENSKRATLSNRAYCIKNPSKYIGYHENQWGLTACDGPKNTTLEIDGITRLFYDYRARGACSIQVVDDGTIAPTAAGGSIAFTPQISEKALEYMWNEHYHNLIGEYGFKDAFNLTYKDPNNSTGWFDVDYLGIDQGPILLQIQNHETEMIWKLMKRNPYIINGLRKAGFSGSWLNQHH